MRITILGGAREVGGSCVLVQIDGQNVLVDCGMRMNPPEGAGRIPDLERLGDRLDLVLLTHAHMDHSGALPLVHQKYPETPIYCTTPTFHLVELLLLDAVKIMEAEQQQSEGEIPLYDETLIQGMLSRTVCSPFNKPVKPIPGNDLLVQFYPAGHILGAAAVSIIGHEGHILVTGDFSVTSQRTLAGINLAGARPDLVISEATYGDRLHDARKEEERRLAEAVGKVIDRGGHVLIPAFAVGRAQELLLILKAHRASGKLPPFPVYCDGMVRSCCDIYENLRSDLHPSLRRYAENSGRPVFCDEKDGIFKAGRAFRESFGERKQPVCVISSSGMLSGGPAPSYARLLAAEERNAVLFTGYQDEESPGRALLDLKRGETIILDGSPVTVNCEVSKYNLSAHADANQIYALLQQLDPQAVILMHGNEAALSGLSRKLKHNRVLIPGNGETCQPLTGTFSMGSQPAHPETAAAEPAAYNKSSSSFQKEDLPALWEKMRGMNPRAYTTPELARVWFGSGFTAEGHRQITATLNDDRLYFKAVRVANRRAFIPRGPDEVRQRQSLPSRPVLNLNPEENSVILLSSQHGALQIGMFCQWVSEDQFEAVVLKSKHDRVRCLRGQLLEVPPIKIDPARFTTAAAIKQELHRYFQKAVKCASNVNDDLIWLALKDENRPFSLAEIAGRFAVSPQNEPGLWQLGVALRLNNCDLYFARDWAGNYIPNQPEAVFSRNPVLEKTCLVRSLPKDTRVLLADQSVVSLTGVFFPRKFQAEADLNGERQVLTYSYSKFERVL
ncbi:MAG: MBL fold metallo-hydrolase [Firmicutes bacterium]|nr:MBL fold metallo-hydrolase [Bacillota bacterium]